MYAKPTVFATGMELVPAKKKQASASVESHTRAMTAASAKRVTPKILILVNASRVLCARMKEAMRIAAATVHASKKVRLQFARAIQVSLTMDSTSVPSALTLFSHTPTARKDNGFSLSPISIARISTTECQRLCSITLEMKIMRGKPSKDLTVLCTGLKSIDWKKTIASELRALIPSWCQQAP